MTLVLAWADNKKNPSSLHIAADSRLSTTDGKEWDYATKIFRVFPTNEHIAYCGDSLLAQSIIGQTIGILAQTSILSKSGTNVHPQLKALAKMFFKRFSTLATNYPWSKNFSLLYCGYDHRKKAFYSYKLSCINRNLNIEEVNLHTTGHVSMGSGKIFADKRLMNGPYGRDDFLKVLKKTINEPSIMDVGGNPQLIRIGKNDSKPIFFKNQKDGRTYLFGAPYDLTLRAKKSYEIINL